MEKKIPVLYSVGFSQINYFDNRIRNVIEYENQFISVKKVIITDIKLSFGGHTSKLDIYVNSEEEYLTDVLATGNIEEILSQSIEGFTFNCNVITL